MKKLFCLVLALGCNSVSALEKLESWRLPEPGDLIAASNALCVDQTKSALLAWHYARKGYSRDEVLALVPESPKALSLRLISAMRENIEDAFSYPDLSQYTLYSFRAEVCMRETLGAVRMPRLAAVRNDVQQCQKTHGVEKSSELFECIKTAVRKAEPQ